MTSITDPTQQRFLLLETKIAYQEKLLQDLNEVIVEQAQTIRELTLRCTNLERAFRESMQEKPAHEKPPHY